MAPEQDIIWIYEQHRGKYLIFCSRKSLYPAVVCQIWTKKQQDLQAAITDKKILTKVNMEVVKFSVDSSVQDNFLGLRIFGMFDLA